MTDPEFKPCPFCAEKIRVKAIRCRYCKADLQDQPAGLAEVGDSSAEVADQSTPSAGDQFVGTMGATGKGCLIVIAAVVVLLIWGALAGGDDDSDPGPGGDGSSSSNGDEYTAEAVCEKFVKERLKAPSTADFSDERVADNGSGSWTVTGNVDSENSFGAKLRNRFTCKMQHVKDYEYRLVNFDLSE